MPQPYVGEIRMFAGNFAPQGWMFCEGQLLPINQDNDALFQLIGTSYGGNGESTFALPDLRGRIPLHQGNGYLLASNGGFEEITVTINQVPAHAHPLHASSGPGASSTPINNVLAEMPSISLYIEDAPNVSLNAQTVAPAGGSQPHTNLQPFLCVNFIIAIAGVFPSAT